jgi:hypothetical protein
MKYLLIVLLALGCIAAAPESTTVEDAEFATRTEVAQVAPAKEGDVVYETHEYQGPNGDEGIINIAYRKDGDDVYRYRQHVGDETRTMPEGWELMTDPPSHILDAFDE